MHIPLCGSRRFQEHVSDTTGNYLSSKVQRNHHRFDPPDILYKPCAKHDRQRPRAFPQVLIQTMDPFPQIVSLYDKVVLILGFSGDTAGHHPHYKEYKSVTAQEIPPMIHASLRRLKIIIGPNICELDDLVLYNTLEHVWNCCPVLESISLSVYAESWSPAMSSLIDRWHLHQSLVLYKTRIIDPAHGSAALTTTRRRNPQSIWASSTSVVSPSNLVEENVFGGSCLDGPQVDKFTVLPPTPDVLYQDDILSQVLRCFRQLVIVSLPIYLISDFVFDFYSLSSLSCLRCMELTIAHTLTPEVKLQAAAALSKGFRQFDNLWRLCLPAEIICGPLLACLGNIQCLEEFRIITTTGPVPRDLPVPLRYHFLVLYTLEVQGTLSDLVNMIRAVCLEMSGLRRLYVEVPFLQYKEELHEALHVITEYCPRLRELGINIKRAHTLERGDWMDLAPISRLYKLREFVIRHPRPLVLTDRDIRLFLQAWPAATFVSFNPRPVLPAWITPNGGIYYPATMNCLVDIVRQGKPLRHFGTYLNARIVPAPADFEEPLVALRELDLGTSHVNRRTAFWLKQLFPNAKQLGAAR